MEKNDIQKFVDSFTNLQAQTITQFRNSSVYYYAGGKFTITPGFISYIKSLQNEKDVIVIDDNYIPIEVSNVKEFVKEIELTYKTAVQDHYDRYKKIIDHNRTLESLFDD